NLVEDEACDPKIVAFSRPLYSLQESELELLIKEWKSYERILLVVGGFREKNPNLESLLQKLAKQNNLVILKEAIANVDGEDFIDQIDPCIELIQEHKLHDFAPDLILTLGGGLVSKKLKFWLRDQKTLAHWHLTKSFEHWDNFQALTRVLQLDPVLFFSRIVGETTETSSNYKEKWLELRSFCADFSKHYLAQNGFTDFKVFEFLLKNLPENSLLQLGNSTPVRYANLLRIESNKNFQMNANRGVSGIDGVLSTAAGASLVKSDKLCFCITGDIAALYDSNALLNLQLKANFKLIIINNGGGNIFRIIPGPSSLDELEQFFETKQDISFEHLALTYKLKYFFASSLASLEELFPAFISEQQLGVILEIKTDGELSANFLKNFFKELRLSKYKN
ncbi:MAG: hypothetical protein KDC82_08605, partial [Bacteroidetes bacterium]|nr:hypothetical protein [Bacteroidota bacterium]